MRERIEAADGTGEPCVTLKLAFAAEAAELWPLVMQYAEASRGAA
jgi:hypothetical protein